MSNNLSFNEFSKNIPLLNELGLKVYWGKGGNWFEVYHKGIKYLYSPAKGKIKKVGEDWGKIGGLVNFMDFFFHDEFKEEAQSIINEVNLVYGTKKRMNRELIALLAIGHKPEFILSRICTIIDRSGTFKWCQIDYRLHYW